MNYSGCKSCMNYREENIWGRNVQYCAGGVSIPEKCSLRERVLNSDIAEFFNATCERYRKND